MGRAARSDHGRERPATANVAALLSPCAKQWSGANSVRTVSTGLHDKEKAREPMDDLITRLKRVFSRAPAGRPPHKVVRTKASVAQQRQSEIAAKSVDGRTKIISQPKFGRKQ